MRKGISLEYSMKRPCNNILTMLQGYLLCYFAIYVTGFGEFRFHNNPELYPNYSVIFPKYPDIYPINPEKNVASVSPLKFVWNFTNFSEKILIYYPLLSPFFHNPDIFCDNPEHFKKNSDKFLINPERF